MDASAQIGTGHFMRCLTLAMELQLRGAKIRFICREIPEHLRAALVSKGLEYIQLSSGQFEAPSDGPPHAGWLGTSQSADAEDTVRALADRNWDWLVVDHYALDARWESALRTSANEIFVIDDIADRQHDCDLLLDQNYYANMNTRYLEKVPPHCRLLLGPRYALLRKEFCRLREQTMPRVGPVKRVLVFFGGTDPGNCTGVAIEALADIDQYNWKVDVVIGALHPFRESIESVCALRAFACHVETDRMAELMAAADLALGAGGSASWERCCLGLPALVVSLADNQVQISSALDELGASIYIGRSEKLSAPAFRRAINSLATIQGKLEALSRVSYSIVDGLGASRTCQALYL